MENEAGAEPAQTVCALCGWPVDVVPGEQISVEEYDGPLPKRLWFHRCTNPGCENRFGRAVDAPD